MTELEKLKQTLILAEEQYEKNANRYSNLRRQREGLSSYSSKKILMIIRNIDKKLKELKKERVELIDLIYKLTEKIEKMDSSIICSDDEIDITSNNNKLKGYYDIYLHNQDISIGFIKYDEEFEDSNIAYEIDEEYQGNNYAYKALCLLSEYLYKNGIESITLSIKENNTPSIRTAEKFMKNNALETTIKEGLGLNKNINCYRFIIGKKKENKKRILEVEE